MEERLSDRLWAACCAATPRDRANLIRVAGALLAWAIVSVGGRLLLTRELVPEGAVAWAVAALSSLAAILVLFAYWRYLRDADELQRTIQLYAMALGFGGGFFALAGYSLFEQAGAPPLDPSAAAVVMSALYALGATLATRRYR